MSSRNRVPQLEQNLSFSWFLCPQFGQFMSVSRSFGLAWRHADTTMEMAVGVASHRQLSFHYPRVYRTQELRRGSSASRRPLPIRLKESAAM
jgi:hypothetical protein